MTLLMFQIAIVLLATLVGGWPFFLFLGISLSITEFPILARIIEERNLQRTSLGTAALMCVAFDDLSSGRRWRRRFWAA